ncbi:MAG: metal-dependent hydrolase [Planctomycetaceae bacterium]
MAAYREHITVSTMLGVGYGLGATFALGFTPAQGALAAWLTALGGMLPDLDSESGRPVREMFGLVAAIAPLALVGRIVGWLGLPSDIEITMLLIVVMYLVIKYGGASLIGAVSVHRGMFHSLPAMAIAAELTYLCYPSSLTTVKLLMASGTATGFFSHLMLDELYSVQWAGVRIKLKKSAGTALKMFGTAFVPNVVTYSILAVLSYAMLVDAGIIQPKPATSIFPQAGPTEDGTNAGDVTLPFDEVHLGESFQAEPSLTETALGEPEFQQPKLVPIPDSAMPLERSTVGELLPPDVDPNAFNPVRR